MILYVTTSPFFTFTGSFLCLYSAVVSVSFFKLLVSITGFLDTSIFSPFTFVIYFLNAKSNSSGSFSIFITGCVFVPFVVCVYNVILLFDFVVPFLYPCSFAFAVFIK